MAVLLHLQVVFPPCRSGLLAATMPQPIAPEDGVYARRLIGCSYQAVFPIRLGISGLDFFNPSHAYLKSNHNLINI